MIRDLARTVLSYSAPPVPCSANVDPALTQPESAAEPALPTSPFFTLGLWSMRSNRP
jgi:hypothetical protein